MSRLRRSRFPDQAARRNAPADSEKRPSARHKSSASPRLRVRINACCPHPTVRRFSTAAFRAAACPRPLSHYLRIRKRKERMARKASRAANDAAHRVSDGRGASHRARAEVEFDEQAVLGALFGEFDANLVQIENRLGVFISARGNRVQIEGPEDEVARAREVLKAMHQRLLRDEELDAGSIEALIAMSSEPRRPIPVFRRPEAVGRQLEPLRPLVPPRRKAWQSEARRMSIFAAAALAMVYWQLSATADIAISG